MKPTAKLYLKTFLWTGITYGILMYGFDLISGNALEFGEYIFMAIFFGAFMSLILVFIHKYRLKKSGVKEITEDNLSTNQTKIFESELNRSKLMEKLKIDAIIGKMKMQEIENGILLQTRASWKSWGEEIKIILKKEKETGFEYQISSSPKLKTTLVDYGKNLENINQIESVIKKIT